MIRNIRAAARFLLFFVATVGIYLIWFLVGFLIPNKQYWRQVIFSLWARSFAAIAGMRVEVIGEPPRPPFFLVCNHLGYVDVAAIRCVVTGVFVAKAEIRSWPLAGRMVADMGQIFINRENRRDIPRAGEEIIQKLGEGEGVIVFPEGTSTKGDDILPFNSSFLEFAARTDLPVSYASIGYRTPKDEPPASQTICWWDETPFITHMLRLFKMSGFTAILNFGQENVINTDRKKLASELREKVREHFIPVI